MGYCIFQTVGMKIYRMRDPDRGSGRVSQRARRRGGRGRKEDKGGYPGDAGHVGYGDHADDVE